MQSVVCVFFKNLGTIYQGALEKITLSQNNTKVCDKFSNTQIEFVSASF